VEFPIGKSRRGVREPDRSVVSDVEAIEEDEGLPIRSARQDAHASVGRYRDEASVGVGYEEVAAGVERHPVGSPAGVGEGLHGGAVRSKPHDAPVLETRVEPAVGAGNDAFGPVPIGKWQELERGHGRVAFIEVSDGRRGGRMPGDRADR
jgi:hypothetical protein